MIGRSPTRRGRGLARYATADSKSGSAVNCSGPGMAALQVPWCGAAIVKPDLLGCHTPSSSSSSSSSNDGGNDGGGSRAGRTRHGILEPRLLSCRAQVHRAYYSAVEGLTPPPGRPRAASAGRRPRRPACRMPYMYEYWDAGPSRPTPHDHSNHKKSKQMLISDSTLIEDCSSASVVAVTLGGSRRGMRRMVESPWGRGR